MDFLSLNQVIQQLWYDSPNPFFQLGMKKLEHKSDITAFHIGKHWLCKMLVGNVLCLGRHHASFAFYTANIILYYVEG